LQATLSPQYRLGGGWLCRIDKIAICSSCRSGRIFGKWQDELSAPFFKDTLHRRRKIQDEVKPIGDLLLLRCAQGCPFGIQAAAITGDRYDFRMPLEPFRKALGGSVRQKLHHLVQVQIDQNRSVILAFAPGPVIDTQVCLASITFSGQRQLFFPISDNYS
jgi:hypothetical protein